MGEGDPEKWWERGNAKNAKNSLPESKLKNPKPSKIKPVPAVKKNNAILSRKKSKNRQTTEFRGKMVNKITKYFNQVQSQKVGNRSIAANDPSLNCNEDQDGGGGWTGVAKEGVGVQETGQVCTHGGD